MIVYLEYAKRACEGSRLRKLYLTSHALTGQEDTFTPEVAGFSLARIIFVQAEELGLKVGPGRPVSWQTAAPIIAMLSILKTILEMLL